MDKSQLSTFANSDRFPQSDFPCPQCGALSLDDNWPPNYWNFSGGGQKGHFSGRQKHICLGCEIQFVQVTTKDRTLENGEWVEEVRHEATEVAPLVERGGIFMTRHDVYLDDYRREHGYYPDDAWG